MLCCVKVTVATGRIAVLHDGCVHRSQRLHERVHCPVGVGYVSPLKCPLSLGVRTASSTRLLGHARVCSSPRRHLDQLARLCTAHGRDQRTDSMGVVGRGCGGTASPHFFRQGGRVPHSPSFFGLKFVQTFFHCCNWLLTETQCKIISVQQN